MVKFSQTFIQSKLSYLRKHFEKNAIWFALEPNIYIERCRALYDDTQYTKKLAWPSSGDKSCAVKTKMLEFS